MRPFGCIPPGRYPEAVRCIGDNGLDCEARILDAATQVIFSTGYDRTTIRALA